MYIIVYNIIILMLLVVCRVSKVSHIALWPKKRTPKRLGQATRLAMEIIGCPVPPS
jgi:hypothetical protein